MNPLFDSLKSSPRFSEVRTPKSSVAMTTLFGLSGVTTIERITTLFEVSSIQRLPSSFERQRPSLVPAKITFGFDGCTRSLYVRRALNGIPGTLVHFSPAVADR